MPAYRFHYVDQRCGRHVGAAIFCENDENACRAAREGYSEWDTDTAEVWRGVVLVAVVVREHSLAEVSDANAGGTRDRQP